MSKTKMTREKAKELYYNEKCSFCPFQFYHCERNNCDEAFAYLCDEYEIEIID